MCRTRCSTLLNRAHRSLAASTASGTRTTRRERKPCRWAALCVCIRIRVIRAPNWAYCSCYPRMHSSSVKILLVCHCNLFYKMWLNIFSFFFELSLSYFPINSLFCTWKAESDLDVSPLNVCLRHKTKWGKREESLATIEALDEDVDSHSWIRLNKTSDSVLSQFFAKRTAMKCDPTCITMEIVQANAGHCARTIKGVTWWIQSYESMKKLLWFSLRYSDTLLP